MGHCICAVIYRNETYSCGKYAICGINQSWKKDIISKSDRQNKSYNLEWKQSGKSSIIVWLANIV